MDAVSEPTLGVMTEARPGMDFAPELHPALYENVQRRRALAFLIDLTAIGLLTFVGAVAITFFGLVSFGLGWALFAVLVPVVVLGYAALGTSRYSATPGMHLFGLTMRHWTGGMVDGFVGALHSFLYWTATSILTPLTWAFGLFNPRKRLLHDIVAGVTVMDAGAVRRVEV